MAYPVGQVIPFGAVHICETWLDIKGKKNDTILKGLRFNVGSFDNMRSFISSLNESYRVLQ